MRRLFAIGAGVYLGVDLIAAHAGLIQRARAETHEVLVESLATAAEHSCDNHEVFPGVVKAVEPLIDAGMGASGDGHYSASM